MVASLKPASYHMSSHADGPVWHRPRSPGAAHPLVLYLRRVGLSKPRHEGRRAVIALVRHRYRHGRRTSSRSVPPSGYSWADPCGLIVDGRPVALDAQAGDPPTTSPCWRCRHVARVPRGTRSSSASVIHGDNGCRTGSSNPTKTPSRCGQALRKQPHRPCRWKIMSLGMRKWAQDSLTVYLVGLHPGMSDCLHL